MRRWFPRVCTWVECQLLNHKLRQLTDHNNWLREAAAKGDVAKVMQGLGAFDKWMEMNG